MTPLQIALLSLAAFLLLLLLLLFFGRAGLSISYTDGLRVRLSILGIRKELLEPKREQAPKELKDLTDCKDPEKEILRARRRRKKQAAKAKKRQAKIEAKKAERQARREQKKQKRASPPLSVGEVLSLVSHLVKKIAEITKGKLRLCIHKLTISVGSEDAATTAVLYGSLSGLLAGLFDFLDANYIPTKIDRGGVSISPDFTSEKCAGEVSLTISTTLWRALLILAKGGISFVRERATAEAHAERRLKNNASESPSADAE